MDNRRLRILLVDDDQDDYVITRSLFTQIKDGKFSLEWVDTYEAALEVIGHNEHDVYPFDPKFVDAFEWSPRTFGFRTCMLHAHAVK